MLNKIVDFIKLSIVVAIHTTLFFYNSLLYSLMRLRLRASQTTPLKQKDISKITIVMPTKNEASRITNLLKDLDRKTSNPREVELIIADGGSNDDTINIANEVSEDMEIYVRIIQERGASGRGTMIHRALRRANIESEAFIILHADTELPFGWDNDVRQALSNPNVVMGSFKFGVDRNFDSLPGAHTTEIAVRLRCHLFWLPFGDQAMFLRREMLDILGGFPNTVFLEDIILSSKCRKYAIEHNMVVHNVGKIAICSSRRWVDKGVALTTLVNFSIITAFSFFNFAPEDLYEYYYGKKVADVSRLKKTKKKQ